MWRRFARARAHTCAWERGSERESRRVMWWWTELASLLGCDARRARCWSTPLRHIAGRQPSHTHTHTPPSLRLCRNLTGLRRERKPFSPTAATANTAVALLPFRGGGKQAGAHRCLRVPSTYSCSHHRACRAEIMKGWPSSDAGTTEGWRMLRRRRRQQHQQQQRLAGLGITTTAPWTWPRNRPPSACPWRRYWDCTVSPSTRSRLGPCATNAAGRWPRDTGAEGAPPPRPEHHHQRRKRRRARGGSKDRGTFGYRETAPCGWNTWAVKVRRGLRHGWPRSCANLGQGRPPLTFEWWSWSVVIFFFFFTGLCKF